MRKRRGWVIEFASRPTADGHERLGKSVRLIVERAGTQASRAMEPPVERVSVEGDAEAAL
jgi:hypothetical protein